MRPIRDKKARRQAQQAIERVKQASGLQEIPNLTKLRGYGTFYRLRIGDYRIGLEVIGDMVIFVRFLHRKDIYRYFP